VTTPVLICDDSSMARKQMFRSLPEDWDIDVSYASNGKEGVEAIQSGKGEITFLDLNMPEMDGYEVLKRIQSQDLPAMVVVVSGDIQPEAYSRVMKLGAMDFVKKPVSPKKLQHLLCKFGVIDAEQEPAQKEEKIKEPLPAKAAEPPPKAKPIIPAVVNTTSDPEMVELLDCYREIANVAMGQAADLLARLLDVFICMPIPNVNFIEVSEFNMALNAIEGEQEISAVCQGFIGSGISGEAIVIFEDSSFADMARLMRFKGEIGQAEELELLMDTANVLIGATLKGLAEQLNLVFSQSHPVVLGRHCSIDELVQRNMRKWKKMLAIEIHYPIENYSIDCELLILTVEEDIPKINERIAYLM